MAVNRPSSIGDLLTQPQVPTAGAPVDPQQVGLWGKFQNRLKQDPNLQMALLTTGLNLLRSPQPGQSGFDVFSDAALTGVGTLDQLRQRDAGAEAAGRDEARADRRLDLSADRVALGERQVNEQGEQFQERSTQQQTQFDKQLGLAREKFEESQRQFNEQLKAGTLAKSQITGSERLVNSGVEALVAAFPEIYPDTKEGRAKARIRAQGLDATGDPLGQGRLIAGLYGDLLENNTFLDEPLTPEQLTEQALALYNTFTSGDTTAGKPDPLDGQQIELPNVGAVQIVSVGENQYKLKNARGELSNETLTAEDIQGLR